VTWGNAWIQPARRRSSPQAGRVDLFAPVLANVVDHSAVPSMRAALKSLHFDLAGAPVEEQLAALLAVADPARVHYGSDFPFTPWQACQYLGQQLETSRHLDDGTRDAIFVDNSYDLFRGSGAGERKPT
jgi:hypothetical protein